MDVIPVLVGAAFTIAVLSYLIGDNPAYRVAVHILVGVGAAYALLVAVSQVLYPGLVLNIGSGNLSRQVFGLFGLLGCIFLLAKLLRRTAWLGNMSVGYLLGVGAGLAMGGALAGTLIPQVISAAGPLAPPGASWLAWISGLLMLVATVTTLIAFAYWRGSRQGAIGAFGMVGRACLYVAFGATFALIFIAGASVLSGMLRDFFVTLNPPPGG